MSRKPNPFVASLVLAAVVATAPLAAQQKPVEDYTAWPELRNPFESTGGGGVMIDGYQPVIEGKHCRTDYSAQAPGGPRSEGHVVFDAIPVQGGVLCANGRWRAKDGASQGTTPFQVFMRDGIVRRPP